ncbi:unnamed protein product [Larinioides sclopetarius]|uniref:Uncharacterized protein n=1 Tax=Larinioides sclopetarius TaxID=280406 RepID=A0AAV1YRU9_9ARAC
MPNLHVIMSGAMSNVCSLLSTIIPRLHKMNAIHDGSYMCGKEGEYW